MHAENCATSFVFTLNALKGLEVMKNIKRLKFEEDRESCEQNYVPADNPRENIWPKVKK